MVFTNYYEFIENIPEQLGVLSGCYIDISPASENEECQKWFKMKYI